MLLDLWFHHTNVKVKSKPVVSVGGNPLNLPLLLNPKIEDKIKFKDDEDIVLLVCALCTARLI